jgi:hypothetical protein
MNHFLCLPTLLVYYIDQISKLLTDDSDYMVYYQKIYNIYHRIIIESIHDPKEREKQDFYAKLLLFDNKPSDMYIYNVSYIMFKGKKQNNPYQENIPSLTVKLIEQRIKPIYETLLAKSKTKTK